MANRATADAPAPDPARPLGRRRLTPWLTVALGLAAIAVGVLLLVRPLAAIRVLVIALGVAALLGAALELMHRGTRPLWVRAMFATALAVLGLTVLFLPSVGVRGVAVGTGAVLIVLGVRDTLVGLIAWRSRLSQLLFGVSGLVLGVLAFAWLDVTVTVSGALFGIWVAVAGVRAIVTLPLPKRYRKRGGALRVLDVGAAALALAVAVLLAVVGSHLTTARTPDAFYTPPKRVPDTPGELLRAEPFHGTVPDGAEAWRILYTTTRAEDVPAVASGLVIVPEGADRPDAIAWAHGTTGIAAGCAPTLLNDPLVAGALPEPQRVIDEGWAIIASDYTGLGAGPPHPYLVGEVSARSVIDAVRAAEQLDRDGRTGFGDGLAVWGHSQGGAVGLWTGGIAPDYAPETDLAGVAALAPAAPLPGMIEGLSDSTLGAFIGPLVIEGFATEYPDVRVEDYVTPQAQLFVEEAAARCWANTDAAVSLLQARVFGGSIWAREPLSGPLGERLEQNVPETEIPVPLLIAQGDEDQIVLPDRQREYLEERCEAGQAMDVRWYPERDHLSLVQDDSPLIPELLQWTRDRFAGEPSIDRCG